MFTIKTPNFNFIGTRNRAFIFSGVLFLISIVSLIYHGGPNFSIDFLGGSVLQLKFEKSVMQDLGKIRSIITSLDLGSPEIKTVGRASDNTIQIMVKKKAEATLVSEQIKTALTKEYGQNPYILERDELVGPKIGSELKTSALLGITLSLIAIILYMAARFSFPFGLAGVIALFHDVFVTVGVFSILDYEISLPIVAALLTIVGFSINDTIVIFDRIRENMGNSLSKQSFEDRCNTSINQTLSRTIITGGTVIGAILVLYLTFFFSGDVIKDFSFAMLIGCISGMYSTIYIATPVVLMWHKKWPIRK